MINVFQNKKELAIAFCDEILKLSGQREKFNFALSGGSTPKIIFQTLAKNYRDKINWNKIQMFWGDERCVPPDDDESNFGMTKKYLLNFIDIPEINVHRILGENDPETETKRYADVVKKYVKLKNGLPFFDLVMLGLGEDGHTASIFPDQMFMLNSKKICEVAVHPSSGQKRITLSGKVINNAQAITFLVTGEKKKEILKKVLIDKNNTLPAEFIQPVSGKLKFYVDEAAAGLL
jgi:6-phosphogluconolactonase